MRGVNSSSPGPSPERSRTTHEFVARDIAQRILSGQLQGGQRLLQSELATKLEVSTTPVREALRDLTNAGLVDFDPHRGAVVHEPDRKEMEEIYELRLILEPLAIGRSVTQLDAHELEAARVVNQLMEEADDFASWAILNRQFHELLTRACGSRTLTAIVGNLSDRSAIYVARSLVNDPKARERGDREHGQLLDAFARGDVAGVEATMRKHLEATRSVLASEPDYSGRV